MKLAWDIRAQDPSAFAKLLSRNKSLGSILDRLESECPIAPTSLPFEKDEFFRPAGHSRSFCMKTKGAACLVFKGTEPMSGDADTVIRQTWEQRPAFSYSLLEHFTLTENEPFLALALPDALYCANLSLEWAQGYLKRFGRLPKTPFPLMVFEMPKGAVTRFSDKLRPYLSDRGQLSARKRLDSQAAKGFGIYVYAYPGIPLRAAHVLGQFPGTAVAYGGPPVQKGIRDVEKTILGWVTLFSEMLIAGYLPTTKIHTGNCLQLHNLAVDGGFCDIDSLERADRIKDPKDFSAALAFSLRELVTSIAQLLRVAEGIDGPVWVFLWNHVRGQVLANKKKVSDPRVLAFFEADGMEILRLLVTMHL